MVGITRSKVILFDFQETGRIPMPDYKCAKQLVGWTLHQRASWFSTLCHAWHCVSDIVPFSKLQRPAIACESKNLHVANTLENSKCSCSAETHGYIAISSPCFIWLANLAFIYWLLKRSSFLFPKEAPAVALAGVRHCAQRGGAARFLKKCSSGNPLKTNQEASVPICCDEFPRSRSHKHNSN